VWNREWRFDERLGFSHHDEWLRYDPAKGWVEASAQWDETG
jgi:hypothetical protein